MFMSGSRAIRSRSVLVVIGSFVVASPLPVCLSPTYTSSSRDNGGEKDTKEFLWLYLRPCYHAIVTSLAVSLLCDLEFDELENQFFQSYSAAYYILTCIRPSPSYSHNY
ncbi:hypothetical protein BJ878DRAFT_490583 [Calycina marina]|uniref:Uncharacterized protein n=1 Tax=Calycina marina TaxID=1763456 RepID=A0A9P8CI45_9HELO|nr:hypothetical protein BJ878DRAFT_490583 [Calycina marina]